MKRHLWLPMTIAVLLLVTMYGLSSVARAEEVTLRAAPDRGSELQGRSEAARLAVNHVRVQREAWGLEGGDIDEWVVSDEYTSRHNGVTHVYLQQQSGGIPVYNAIVNVNLLPDGTVLHSGNRAVTGLEGSIGARAARITPIEAVGSAAESLGLTITAPLQVLSAGRGAAQETEVSDGGISRAAIPVELVYYPVGPGDVRLSWQVAVDDASRKHYWLVHVDAIDGQVLAEQDLVIAHTFRPRGETDHAETGAIQAARLRAVPSAAGHGSGAARTSADGSSYRVFALPFENPNDGAATVVSEPAHALASPYGWHDTDGVAGAEHTITRGNNVHAYQDRSGNDVSSGDEPDGSATLTFDFPYELSEEPVEYVDAATVNLFYWSNVIHDLTYVLGFDEAAGNFQANNYGRGGLGDDWVLAEAQDRADMGARNNAYFFALADGVPPRMEMFLWTVPGGEPPGTPERDGDLDSGIILHEYGHGISTRLTGGPSNASCLSEATYHEQAGEGWSDWQSLIYTALASDGRNTVRGIATYGLFQAPSGSGIRAFPYATDMMVNPQTYADTRTASVPHGVGSIWATILWEVYWNLVDEYGFNPDFYANWDQGGNLLAMQLVMDGLKLQPCGPGFVDARDAILAADVALTGGANRCLLWEAFAKRGLGYSAQQGSSTTNSDNVAAFDMPPGCSTLVCNGSAVDFEAGLPPDWTVTNDSGNADAIVWTTTTDPLCWSPNQTGGAGDAACADSDAAGSGSPAYDTSLIGPAFDLTDHTRAILHAKGYYRDLGVGNDRFEVDVWDGSSWNNALTWDENHMAAGSGQIEVDLTPYVGNSDVQVRFRYSGNGWDWFAQVDEVALECSVPAQIEVSAVGMSAHLPENSTLTRTLTITNSGEHDLEWSVDEWESSTGRPVELALSSGEVGSGHQRLPPAASTPIELALDDGSRETAIGNRGQFIWLNRFTPDATEYPFLLEEIRVMFGNVGVEIGEPAELLVYEDTDGDGDPGTGATLLASYDVTVQGVNAWSVYQLTPPVVLNGPGDVLIGVVNRDGAEGTDDFPAAIDRTASQNRSWAGSYLAGDVPDNPTLPADATWGTIDSFGFPGNWLVRGYGIAGECAVPEDVAWLSVTPASGTVPGKSSTELEVAFDATGMAPGVYDGTLCIRSNDAITPVLSLPVSMTVELPTAVMLARFEATGEAEGVRLEWETVAERDNVGFHLYRATRAEGPVERLTGELIPSAAPGSSAGATYQWHDSGAAVGVTYYYWLESVEFGGGTQRHGPVSAMRQAPSALALSEVGMAGSGRSGQAVVMVVLGLVTLVAWGRWRRTHR